MSRLWSVVLAVVVSLLAADARAALVEVDVLPTPQEVKARAGALELKAGGHVVATEPGLVPLARVVSGEIARVAGVSLDVSAGAGAAGDVVLAIDKSLAGKAGQFWPHTLDVDDRTRVAGADYDTVAMGTATLLQLMKVNPGGGCASLPRVAIRDYSAAAYPGLMVDVARQNNTLADVRDVVELCRLYKVRYLHLHLNDMESFVFPSERFPKLGTHNGSAFGGPKCERWDRAELLRTIAYADERGVAIVPELETVFHTGAMMKDMPAEFGGPGVLNIGSEHLYASLEPLIEEMCDVFRSSPFFQIGCDEASIGGVMGAPGTRAYMAARGLKTGDELYRFHINRLDKVVRAKGKRTIVWQDCPLPTDNKQIICMLWHMDWDHGDTAKVMKAGYPTIQVTWTPGCASPVKDLFAWRPFDEQVAPGPLALGSQLVLWEQNGSVAVPFLRQKMPARQQFTVNPSAAAGPGALTYPRFAEALAHADGLLDPLLTGIVADERGLAQDIRQWLDAGGAGETPPGFFTKTVTVTFATHVAGATVRYTLEPVARFKSTILYGTDPTAASPAVDGPVTVAPPPGNVQAVRLSARAFDAAGKPVGSVWRRTYRWQPFAVVVTGTVAPADDRFGTSAVLRLSDAAPAEGGGAVRYAVGGPVSAKSPAFDGPVTIEKSAAVSIGYFDAAGKPRGTPWTRSFRKVDFDPENLTYHKSVIQWGSSSKRAAEVAVDGVVDHDHFLDIQPAPQQFAVDLEQVHRLSRVVLYTFWDGGRYYQYRIDVSTDREHWTPVADASANTAKATEHGYAHTFKPIEARYVRVTMLRNSANAGLHIVELRAYEEK